MGVATISRPETLGGRVVGLSERRERLVETHEAVEDAGLPYVLIGGWAVSAFQQRFTADVDFVLPASSLSAYDDLLDGLGYERQFDETVSNAYEGRIVRYERPVGDNSVQFDALVDAVRCRQTDAEWSYRYLHEHSRRASLEVTPGLTARVPEPSLLFSLKLHSGRRADARDLVVVGAEADLERVERHLYRGDTERLADRISTVIDRLDDERFEDSFKGVFQRQTLPTETVDHVRSTLLDCQSRLD